MATFEIKTTVSTQDVLNMFEKAGRGNSFTYDGLEEILNHIESYSDEGVINLDIIAICCDYTECTLDNYLSDYGYDKADFDDVDDIMAVLQAETWGVYLGAGKVVYLNY